MTTQAVTTKPTGVKDLLALPAYKDRFQEVLGKRGPQFLASIVAVSQMQSLKDANPKSVIAAAMVAATLDLPVNPTLGMAHIVAYKAGSSEVAEAQFQIGYKGLIQLALRSGQYRKMNSGPVNEGVFDGYDMVGEPKLDFSRFDPTKEIVGYFCAFELTNGFIKVVYWPKKQVEAHAKRFSKAYSKGFKSSPWFTDFDGMATKTVIKNALTKWGIMSVELQKAVIHDQGAQSDVDGEVKFIDTDAVVSEEPKARKQAPELLGGPKKPRTVVPEGTTTIASIKALMAEAKIEEADLLDYLRRNSVIDESLSSLEEACLMSEAGMKAVIADWSNICTAINMPTA